MSFNRIGLTLTPAFGTLVFSEVFIEHLLGVLLLLIRGIWVLDGAAPCQSSFFLFVMVRTLCIPSLRSGARRLGAGRGFGFYFGFGLGQSLGLWCGFGFGFGFGAWFSNFICRWV